MTSGDLARAVARPTGQARARITWLVAVVLGVATLGAPRAALAQDRVTELSATLSSSSPKARLSAAVALGNLGDRRAMKPLVGALSDQSPQIRAVAAAALGKLGHAGSLPALKNAATDDRDAAVRKAARQAALAVAKANQLASPWPAPEDEKGKPGFGRQPRAIGPDVYVLVNTSADESPGKADKTTRKEHADIVRQMLVSQCESNPVVTTVAADAKRFGLDPRNIDLSVVKMDVATVGAVVEVDAQLRLAISDGQGKMLSFLSGGAKIQVPKHKFDARYLPRMRREALEGAVRGMFDKLLAHLRDRRATS